MSGEFLYGEIRFGDDWHETLKYGVLLAWLADHRLLDAGLEKDAGHAIASVRFHDLKGTELLSTVLHGELRARHVSAAGNEFLESYVVNGSYAADFEQAFTSAPPREDEWHFYDRIAPVITRAFATFRQPPKHRSVVETLAKVIPFRRR